ncbi:MAG: FAD binding domain-containing protein [Myxococcota bacterium]
MDLPSVFINGKAHSLAGVDPHMSLLHFVRDRGLTGTKEGCAEGECGACAVVQLKGDGEGTRFVPINSCLMLAVGAAGQHFITSEGVRGSHGEDTLHPVQEAMVEQGGSQCGYCTPGFVASLFAEYYRKGRKAEEYDPEAIAGNLCRCTGYRPIRDALVSLRTPSKDDPTARRLESPTEEPSAFEAKAGGVGLRRPRTFDELWQAFADAPTAKLVAGGTDVAVAINHFNARFDNIVLLDGIDALKGIDERDDAIVLGAGVSLSDLEHHFHGRADLPIFDELFSLFSSRLIRNRATLGGNLVNASPIGDSPPALMALDAQVTLAHSEGERTLELADFFTAYRQTKLQPGEILARVTLPKPLPDVARFYKVSKRVMDDISTVAAGFGLWIEGGRITKARLAYGGVAATPVRAKDAEALLVGQPLSATGAVLKALGDAFAPMSDHRGSAEYRQAMVPRLFEKLAAEVRP